MTQKAAQRQTVTMGDGIAAIRSTTCAVIIKKKAFVQFATFLSKKPNHIITAALNIAAVLH